MRRAAGFDFPGTDPEITGHQAVVEMEGAENLGKGWHTTPGGTYAHGWAPDGLLDTYTTERHPIRAWVLNWTRAQVALMRTDPHSRALRDVVADLLDTTTGTTYMARKISGLWQGYGDGPVVGRSAPDLALADGSRLDDHLHDGRGLLLDLDGTQPDAAGYEDRVTRLTTKAVDDTDLTGLLVRPDGVVAWAGEGSLDEALATWFGSPRRDAGT